MEQKRMEIRLRSERLERERRALLKLAVHNSARLKAEKYGFQWEDVEFYEEEIDYDNARRERVAVLQVPLHQQEDEKMDDSDGEGEAEEGGSSDEWADVSSSASGGGSSDEREASGSTSFESAQEEPAAGGEASCSLEEPAGRAASPPSKRQTTGEWAGRGYAAGEQPPGGGEPQAVPAERRCGTYRAF